MTKQEITIHITMKKEQLRDTLNNFVDELPDKEYLLVKGHFEISHD